MAVCVQVQKTTCRDIQITNEIQPTRKNTTLWLGMDIVTKLRVRTLHEMHLYNTHIHTHNWFLYPTQVQSNNKGHETYETILMAYSLLEQVRANPPSWLLCLCVVGMHLWSHNKYTVYMQGMVGLSVQYKNHPSWMTRWTLSVTSPITCTYYIQSCTSSTAI